MKKRFPEVTFLFNSENNELFPETSKGNTHAFAGRLFWLLRKMKRQPIHKRLAANEMIYDRYKTNQCHRVLLSLDSRSWLLWYGMPHTLFGSLYVPWIPFFFSNSFSLEIQPHFTISLRGGQFSSRFDHFCSENICPLTFKKSNTNLMRDPCIKVDFSYRLASGCLYRRIKYSSFNVFWVIQIQARDDNILPAVVIPSYKRTGYKKLLTNIEISLGNERYNIFVPQRPHLVKLPGFEKMPHDSEIMVTKFIDGEVDLFWAVSGNQIKRYG